MDVGQDRRSGRASMWLTMLPEFGAGEALAPPVTSVLLPAPAPASASASASGSNVSPGEPEDRRVTGDADGVEQHAGDAVERQTALSSGLLLAEIDAEAMRLLQEMES